MPNKIDDAIFDFAYVMAMRDATQQRAFSATDKKLLWQAHSDENREEALAPLRENIKKLLRNYIGKILDENVKPEDVPDFYEVADKIQRAANEFVKEASMKVPPKEGEQADGKLAVFTFGNTQKLINMTVKYMFIATYDRPELRERFKQCHCPMDSIMLDQVAKRVGVVETESKQKEFATKFVKVVKHRDGSKEHKIKDISWSTLEWKSSGKGTETGAPNEYLLFQAAIKELAEEKSLNPIEYDFFAWGQ